jgi:hypothetical protein
MLNKRCHDGELILTTQLCISVVVELDTNACSGPTNGAVDVPQFEDLHSGVRKGETAPSAST